VVDFGFPWSIALTRWHGSDTRKRRTGAVALCDHGRGGEEQRHSMAMEEAERSSGGRQEAMDRAPNHKLGLHFWIMERAQSKMGEVFRAYVWMKMTSQDDISRLIFLPADKQVLFVIQNYKH
jgi:hypothetical protein